MNVPVRETEFESGETQFGPVWRRVEFDPSVTSFRLAGGIGCAGRPTAAVDLTAEREVLRPRFGLVRTPRRAAAFPASVRLLFRRIHGFVNWPGDD